MLYWALLGFGGALLLLSLISGGEGDADLGGDGLEGGLGDLGSWLNLRALVSFATFFGLGGVLGGWLGLGGAVQFAYALVAGLAVAFLTSWLFRMARQSEGGTRSVSLVGRTARVIVPPRPGRTGKVQLERVGQLTDVLATSADTLSVGETVIVIDEVEGQVEVARWSGP